MLRLPPIQWHEVTWYSRWGSIIFFILLLPVFCFYLGMRYENVTSNVYTQSIHETGLGTVSTNNTHAVLTGAIHSDNLKLLYRVSELYEQSSSSLTGCLNRYLDDLEEKRTEFNLTTNCPKVIAGVATNPNDIGSLGFEQVLVLQMLLEDAMPAEAHFNEIWGTFDEIDELLFKQYVLSDHLRNYASQIDGDRGLAGVLERLHTLGTFGYDSIESFFHINTMEVTPSTTLVLITDKANAGSYNTLTTVYEVKNTKVGIDVTLAKLVNATSGKIIVEKSQTDNSDVPPGLMNAYFDTENKLLIYYDMMPYGTFPCMEYRKYKYFDEAQLIHVSTDQAKGCKSKEFKVPADIPKNFDRTPVEIYRTKDADLRAALQF